MPASAGGKIKDGLSTCTLTNCSSKIVQGFFDGTLVGTAYEPFTVQVFAQRGECLRLEVTGQTADMQIGVIGPDVVDTWVDDDSGPGLQPLVKIASTPNSGWYTVAIGRYTGAGSDASFTLRVGRYDSGNPNCLNPTPISSSGISASSVSK